MSRRRARKGRVSNEIHKNGVWIDTYEDGATRTQNRVRLRYYATPAGHRKAEADKAVLGAALREGLLPKSAEVLLYWGSSQKGSVVTVDLGDRLVEDAIPEAEYLKIDTGSDISPLVKVAEGLVALKLIPLSAVLVHNGVLMLTSCRVR